MSKLSCSLVRLSAGLLAVGVLAQPGFDCLSSQVRPQPVWIGRALQVIHLANTLPGPLPRGLGPILVLSVARGFHSSTRWRRTTESTQVGAPCPVGTARLPQLPCRLILHPGFAPAPVRLPPITRFLLRLPLGEKPFSCGLCPQRSRDFSAMAKHLRTHGAAPYRCPLCGVGCSSLASMQAHMRSHSPSQLPPGWTIRSTFLYSSSPRPPRASTSPGSPSSTCL